MTDVQLGVGRARITGTVILRLGNCRYAVWVSISVRPDCLQLACNFY